MAGIYIHIPFCARKCVYCDFYSLGAKNAPWPEFTSALLAELRTRLPELKGERVDTIYIGGGTPSLIPAAQFEELVEGLRADVLLRDVQEFTVEVNPDDVTPQLVERFLRTGVNRVSMGVQSFEDAELRRIGRRHTAAQARHAYELLRGIGNVSLDLIFGLPGQTPESWRRSVSELVALRPEHVSAYALMWEEGTALSVMRRQGRVQELPEAESLAMYEYLREELAAAGYEHYEVSNYALPGRHSRHNRSYWLGAPYLGLGPGAHSYDGLRVRRANPADVKGYIRAYAQPEPQLFCEPELLSDEELREEYVMTRLRTCEGIDCREYESRFGSEALGRLRQAAAPHIAAGRLMCENGIRISIPERHLMLLDALTVDLL